MKQLCILVLIALSCCNYGESAKILGVLPACGKSHFAFGVAMMNALAEKGHEITVISCFPMPKSNFTYREIQLTGLYDFLMESASIQDLFKNEFKSNPFQNAMAVQFMGLHLTEKAMEHENMRAFLAEKNNFDLVIAEGFGTETIYGFAHHFNAPLIVTSTTTTISWINDLTGNPEPLSYVPNPFLPYNSKMTFWERMMNTIVNAYHFAFHELFYYEKHEKLMKKYFPNSKKSLRQIMREDVSLVFLNTHFSLSMPRPYVPNMIEIGGINIDRTMGKLPTDIQQFLDSAKDGVILFSMGSFILPSYLTQRQRKAFIDAFAKLKQKVIWRYDLDDADTLPKNILVKKWLPQNEIMGHPNVKLFMTHGGMLGTTEGVYHGLPMIGIPFFGDQHLNIGRAVLRGYALKLNINNITESDVTDAVKEIITNPKYSEKAKELSKIYRDQPMTPQENVVYWSEYVIRHKGAPHLRVEGLNLGFIEYHNLDVFFVLIMGFVVLILIPQIICCRFVFRKMFTKKTKSKVKKN